MNTRFVVIHYLSWHYSVALASFSVIYRDIIFFVADYFSLPILLKSFFAPWRRLAEPYPENKFNLSEIAAVVVVNSLMRLVGVIMRSIIIIVGLIVLVATIIFYPIILLLWLALPVIVLLFLLVGSKLLFF